MFALGCSVTWVCRSILFLLCESLNCGESIPIFRGNNCMRLCVWACVYAYVCVCACVEVWCQHFLGEREREDQKSGGLLVRRISPSRLIKGDSAGKFQDGGSLFLSAWTWRGFLECVGLLHIGVLWRNRGFYWPTLATEQHSELPKRFKADDHTTKTSLTDGSHTLAQLSLHPDLTTEGRVFLH